MRSFQILIGSGLVLGATILGFIFSSFGPSTSAYAAPSAPPRVSSAINAAPAVTYTVYLPLITRGCANTQLLLDTGFEAGLPNASWQTTSTIGSLILDNSSLPSPNPTHGGSWKAFLGGTVSQTESLWQNFSVPAGTSSLSLSFWRRVSTNEPSPFQFDSLKIQVRDSVNTPLQTIYTLYDGDAGTTWVQHTLSISPTYSSQNIQVAFFSKNDASSATSFFIDDMTMTACH